MLLAWDEGNIVGNVIDEVEGDFLRPLLEVLDAAAATDAVDDMDVTFEFVFTLPLFGL